MCIRLTVSKWTRHRKRKPIVNSLRVIKHHDKKDMNEKKKKQSEC